MRIISNEPGVGISGNKKRGANMLLIIGEVDEEVYEMLKAAPGIYKLQAWEVRLQ